MNLQLFFERLKAERVARGLTQDAMASAVGVSKRSYCAYEAGETAPSAKLLAALATMEMDIAYLLTGVSTKGQALIALQERAAASVPADMTEFADIKALLQREVAAMQAALAPPELPARHKKLLKHYDAADEAGKKIIEGTASLAAQPKAARAGRK